MLEDILVWFVLLPGDVKYVSEMEVVEALFQLRINCSYFTTVEEGAMDTSLVYLNLGVLDGVLSDRAVLSHPLSLPWHD